MFAYVLDNTVLTLNKWCICRKSWVLCPHTVASYSSNGPQYLNSKRLESLDKKIVPDKPGKSFDSL